METLKVKYTGKWHTMVTLNWNQVKVKESEIIVIPASEQGKFLWNDFAVAWTKDEKLLETLIDKIEREIEDENKKVKRISKDILDKAKEETKAVEAKAKPLQDSRKERVEELKVELQNTKDEKVKLSAIKNKEIEQLQAEKEALDKSIEAEKAKEEPKKVTKK